MIVPIVAKSKNSMFIWLFFLIFIIILACSVIADYFIGEELNEWIQIASFGLGLLFAFYLLPYLARFFRMGSLELYDDYIHIRNRKHEETINLKDIKRLEIFEERPIEKKQLGFYLCSLDVEFLNGDKHHFMISLRPGETVFFKKLVKTWNANNFPIKERRGMSDFSSRAA